MSERLGEAYCNTAEILNGRSCDVRLVCGHLKKIVKLIDELNCDGCNAVASFEYHGYGGYIEIWDTNDRTCRFEIFPDGHIEPAGNDA